MQVYDDEDEGLEVTQKEEGGENNEPRRDDSQLSADWQRAGTLE